MSRNEYIDERDERDDAPLTDEEANEVAANVREWFRVRDAWMASGKRCACGSPITLDEAMSAPYCCEACALRLTDEGQ